jgi:hypothetical protein
MTNRPIHIEAEFPEVVDDLVADVLRRKSGAEKIRMVASGWTLLRAMHAVQVRHAHPDWMDEQVRVEVNQRMADGST